MSKRLKIKFKLHQIVIVLFCLALLAALMQGITYFSLNSQAIQAKQAKALVRTLARQTTFSLAPLMDEPEEESDETQIRAILQHITEHSRVLDASVYSMDGELLVHEGEPIGVRQRLALERKNAGVSENQQIVEMIEGKEGPLGFVRLTLDTRISKAEEIEQQNAANMLRLMLALAAAIGFILARVLLARRPDGSAKTAHTVLEPERSLTAVNEKSKLKKKRPYKKKPYHSGGQKKFKEFK